MQTSSGSRPNPSKQSLQRVVACDASKAVAANVTGELLQLACESQLVEKGGGATMRKNMGLVYRSTLCSTSCVNMQGLVTVPFWEYWTSPYSSHYRPYT